MSELSHEFEAAKASGWIPLFEKAGKEYDFAPSLLLAIGSRESNLRNIVGDGGHGYSLMQIDDRSYPEFCHSGAWHSVGLAIEKGTQVLDAKRSAILHGQGAALNVGGWKFIGKKIAGPDA